MIVKYYSVFDTKVGAFMPPFAARSDGEAMRSFGDAIGDGKSQFAAHPEDYQLFYVGSFDDSSGLFVGDVRETVHLMSGVQAVVK